MRDRLGLKKLLKIEHGIIESNERIKNQKCSSSNFLKLQQEQIERANRRCQLTAEEANRLNKLESEDGELKRSEKCAKPLAANLVKRRRIQTS